MTFSTKSWFITFGLNADKLSEGLPKKIISSEIIDICLCKKVLPIVGGYHKKILNPVCDFSYIRTLFMFLYLLVVYGRS